VNTDTIQLVLIIAAILFILLSMVGLLRLHSLIEEEHRLLDRLHRLLDVERTWERMIGDRFAAWVEAWVYDVQVEAGEPEHVARAKASAAAERTRQHRPRQEQA